MNPRDEFRSKLEDILPAKELRFSPTPGFQGYKHYLSHAIAHPAKMNMHLLRFLIENFTEKGDVVLDPMAGSGSTGVVASLHGRNAVCVDIEEKFHKWMEEARRKVEGQKTFTEKGWIRNVCGDARKLSELLKEVDVVVTSPPFANSFRHNPQDKEKRLQKLIEVEKNAVKKGQKWAMSSREVLKRKLAQQDNGYGKSQKNIGNLPLGSVDAVITSPPYGEAQQGSGIAKRGYQGNKHSPTDLVGERSYMPDKFASEENISRLPMRKVDAVITSPPYAHESTASKPTKLEKQGLFKMGHSNEEPYTNEDYREWSKREGGNIGKRKFFIRVPCSRDEADFHDKRQGRKGTIWEWTKEVEATQEIIEKVQKLKSKQKGKSETYLEAMLKVYSEMFKVLKPNGKAIIVIKPFIRNKKVIDLPYHTWLLLKKVGFKLVQLFRLRLKQESFWRILYHKKYPEVPKIKHEYVLVCKKPLRKC